MERITKMLIDCMFNKEEIQEEMNGFIYVRPKDNGGE